MAITKDQLEVQIKVESQGAAQKVNQVTDAVEKLRLENGRFATKEQAEMAAALKRTQAAMDSTTGSTDHLQAEMQQLQEQAKKLGLGMKDIEAITGTKLPAAAGRMGGGFRDVLTNMFIPVTTLNQALALTERAMAQVNRVFSAFLGNALQLESEVAKINTLLTEQERVTVNAAQGILDLQKQYGTSQKDAAESYYRVLSSGAVEAADAHAFLEDAIRLSVGGVTSLESATNVLTSVMAAYGMQAKDVAHINDALFIAARDGKTDIADLSREIGNALGVSAQLGVTFDELAAATSAMTLSGISTSEAVTSINSAMIALARQTEDMSALLKSLGITSVKAAIEQEGLVGVLRRVTAASGGSAEAVINLMGRFEAMKAVSTLTSDNIGKTFDRMHKSIQDSAANAGEATNNAFRLIQETGTYQLNLLGEKSKAIFTEMGMGAAEALGGVVKSINAALDSVASAIAGVQGGMARVDFAGLAKEAAIFAAEIAGVAAAFWAVSAAMAGISVTGMIAGISAITGALLTAAKAAWAFVAAAAPMAWMAIKVTVLAAAVDVLARNMDNLGNLTVAVFGGITNAVVVAFGAITQFVQGMVAGIRAVGGSTQASKLEGWLQDLTNASFEMSDNIEAKMDEARQSIDLGFLGKALEGAANFMGGYEDATAGAAATVKKLGDEIGKTAKKAQDTTVAPQTDTMRRYESIRDMVKQLRGEVDRLTMSEEDAVKANAKRSIAEIEGVRKQLAAEHRLFPERAKMLDEATALTIQKKDAELKAIQEKFAASLLDANVTYAQAMGDQTAIARAAYDKQLAEYDEMLKKKLISDEQYAKLKAKAEEKKAMGEAKGAGASAGEFGQKEVTQSVNMLGSFMQGFSDSLLGPVAAVQGVVSIAQGIVDAIPNLLSSLTNLVLSFVELPTKIMEGVVALAKAIPRIISEFIPRLLEAIPEIIYAVLEMIYIAIPNAFMTLMAKIPEFVEKLMAKLPDLIQKLVTGFVTAMPKIVLSLVNLMINGIPAIIRAVIRAIPVIVEAIIDGLVDGVMMIGDMIASIFTGGSFFKSMGEDLSETLSESMTGVLKSVTGVGDQMFSLLEEGMMAPAQDMAGRIGKAIEQATGRAVGWLARAWEGLKQAGRWLDANIFQPAWGAIKAAWSWVYDNVLKPIWDIIVLPFQWAWSWIYGMLIGPMTEKFKEIWGGLVAAGQWIWDHTFAPFFDMLKTVGGWIWDAFSAAAKAAWDVLKSFGGAIWEGLKGAWTLAKDFLGTVGGWIWDGLKAAFEGAADLFKKLGGWIWNGLSAGIEAVGSVLGKLFKFDGGGRGAVEKFIGLDFPWVAFAEGGVVPGRATVRGDDKRNDIIPALLSPGEVVLPRSVLQDDAFRRVVLAKLEGRDVPQYSLGGWIKEKAKATGSAIAGGAKAVGGAISSGAKAVVDFVVPDWIMDLYNSIKRFVSGIDLKELVKDPAKALNNAIRGSLDVFAPFFQQMVQNVGGFANGGLVPPGSTDTVPTMLTPGEFVMRRDAVQRLGIPTLNALNAGGNAGGDVHQEVNVTLNIKTEQPIDERFVRANIIPEVEKQLRRLSLDGRRVLAPAGVR